MSNPEIVIFLIAAAVAGGMTMGGVTLVYFLDKWRDDSRKPSAGSLEDHIASSPFREAR